uniref:Uncharacterized protein n=1 Tax=Phragmatopoma lapidosa TaxID=341668 RepID=Q3Y674_9ANNE|nr:Hypothetical protein [Phragmatopoma lapidosa]
MFGHSGKELLGAKNTDKLKLFSTT